MWPHQLPRFTTHGQAFIEVTHTYAGRIGQHRPWRSHPYFGVLTSYLTADQALNIVFWALLEPIVTAGYRRLLLPGYIPAWVTVRSAAARRHLARGRLSLPGQGVCSIRKSRPGGITEEFEHLRIFLLLPPEHPPLDSRDGQSRSRTWICRFCPEWHVLFFTLSALQEVSSSFESCIHLLSPSAPLLSGVCKAFSLSPCPLHCRRLHFPV